MLIFALFLRNCCYLLAILKCAPSNVACWEKALFFFFIMAAQTGKLIKRFANDSSVKVKCWYFFKNCDFWPQFWNLHLIQQYIGRKPRLSSFKRRSKRKKLGSDSQGKLFQRWHPPTETHSLQRERAVTEDQEWYFSGNHWKAKASGFLGISTFTYTKLLVKLLYVIFLKSCKKDVTLYLQLLSHCEHCSSKTTSNFQLKFFVWSS